MSSGKYFFKILVDLIYNDIGIHTFKKEFVKDMRDDESEENKNKEKLLVGIFNKTKKYYIETKKLDNILRYLRKSNYCHVENIKTNKGIFIENIKYCIENVLFNKISSYINQNEYDDFEKYMKSIPFNKLFVIENKEDDLEDI
uniref:Uncharacterized protein n=1 Tax=viral metagenome TaxID=1070528 RepID=A0A6C0H593_9ZZZZ